MSEPNGTWKYVQYFGWLDSKKQCEQIAQNEAKVAKEFSNPQRSFVETDIRRMVLRNMTYECLTDNEIADMRRKENEKYDN